MAFSSRPHEASQDGGVANPQQKASMPRQHGLQMSRSGSVAAGLSKAGNSHLSGSVNKPFGALKRSTTQASGLSSKSSNTVKRQLLPTSRSKEDIWGSSWKSSTTHAGVTSTTQHRSTTPPLSPGATKQTQIVQQRPTMTGLRSPPPLSKSLAPKRSIDAGESDRPAKRPAFGSALPSTSTFSSGLSALANDAASGDGREKPTIKPRRSTALPSSKTSNALSSLHSTEKVVAPSLNPPLAARRTSNIFAQSSASLAPLASSSSTLSFSPSKFGLTVPREFNFSVSPKDKPKALQAEHHNSVSKSRGLAPSPLEPDEHVPRPIAFVSGTTTSQKTKYGALPSVSPNCRSEAEVNLKSYDLMQRTIERNKEMKVSGMMLSPLRGNYDLSQSPIRGAGRLDDRAAPPKLSSPALPSVISDAIPVSPKTVASKAVLLPSIRLHPDDSEQAEPSVFNLAPSIPSPTYQQIMPSSPLKRPRSPSPPPTATSASTEASSSRSIKPRRSMITRSLSAGEIARQAVKDDQPAANLQPAQHTTATAKRRLPGHGLPRAQSSRNIGRTAAAPASVAEVGRPPATAVRSVSAPMPRNDATTRASTALEAENAMEVLAEKAETREPGDGGNASEDSLEMDTSIMSSSGQASLANLQSLLSRMSIPRASISRRSSANSSTLHLLDERAEIEQEMLASGNVHPDNKMTTEVTGASTSRAVPRYAAPTTSSTARFALSYTNPGVPVRSSYALQKQKHAEVAALGLPIPIQRGIPTHRKISNPPPGAVRGSLLPLASSTSAAQNAIKRSSSSPTKEMDVDKPKAAADAGDGVIKPEKSTTLKNVVAFVDVKTAEGDDAGGVFVDILRSLGARVRPDAIPICALCMGVADLLSRSLHVPPIA